MPWYSLDESTKAQIPDTLFKCCTLVVSIGGWMLAVVASNKHAEAMFFSGFMGFLGALIFNLVADMYIEFALPENSDKTWKVIVQKAFCKTTPAFAMTGLVFVLPATYIKNVPKRVIFLFVSTAVVVTVAAAIASKLRNWRVIKSSLVYFVGVGISLSFSYWTGKLQPYLSGDCPK